MERRTVWTVRGWMAWIQATGGGKGGPGSDQGGTISFNMSQSCLATVSAAKAQAGQLVVTLLVAERATTVLLPWRLLNSVPVFSGVGRGGVYVSRAINDSIIDKGVGMNLLSWSWGVWTDRKGSGRFGSWKGGWGLQDRKSVV